MVLASHKLMADKAHFQSLFWLQRCHPHSCCRYRKVHSSATDGSTVFSPTRPVVLRALR